MTGNRHDNPLNRLPFGPIAVSLVLVLTGAAYLALRPSRPDDLGAAFFRRPPRGTVRVVTWNIGWDRGGPGTSLEGWVVDAVADALNRLHADVICLQAVESEECSESIAAALDGEWSHATIRDGAVATHHMTVLVRRSMQPIQRRLLDTRADRSSIVYDVQVSDRGVGRFACADASGMDGPWRHKYFADLNTWVGEHPAALTVLAGSFGTESSGDSGVGGSTDSRTLDLLRRGWIECGPAGVATTRNRGQADRVFAMPKTVSVARAAVVTGAAIAGVEHLPIVVDIVP